MENGYLRYYKIASNDLDIMNAFSEEDSKPFAEYRSWN